VASSGWLSMISFIFSFVVIFHPPFIAQRSSAAAQLILKKYTMNEAKVNRFDNFCDRHQKNLPFQENSQRGPLFRVLKLNALMKDVMKNLTALNTTLTGSNGT
jgi:hypothetical protein